LGEVTGHAHRIVEGRVRLYELGMQRAALPTICEKWSGIGLSTAPADREEVERGAVELYQALGLEAPEDFIWFKSFDEALGLLHMLQRPERRLA